MSSCPAQQPPDPVMVLSGKCSVTSLLFWNQNVLFTGHQNGQVQEWKLSIQRAITTWDAHSDTVLWLACVQGDKLFSQSRDGVVKVWTKSSDLKTTWTVIAQVPSARLIFCNCAIINAATRSFLVVPSEETSHANVHEILHQLPLDQEKVPTTTTTVLTPTPVRTLKTASVKDYGMCMKMCPTVHHTAEGRGQLLVGYESGSIALWDVSTGEMLHSLRLHQDSVMCLACLFHPDSGKITGISGSVDNILQSWSILKADDIYTVNEENSVSVTNEGFNALAIRNDRHIFITGGWDGRGRVFSVKKLRPLAVLTYHKESINCVAFGPDNELVAASKDGYISFWDVYKNR